MFVSSGTLSTEGLYGFLQEVLGSFALIRPFEKSYELMSRFLASLQDMDPI